jgi:hypothetical protein
MIYAVRLSGERVRNTWLQRRRSCFTLLASFPAALSQGDHFILFRIIFMAFLRSACRVLLSSHKPPGHHIVVFAPTSTILPHSSRITHQQQKQRPPEFFCSARLVARRCPSAHRIPCHPPRRCRFKCSNSSFSAEDSLCDWQVFCQSGLVQGLGFTVTSLCFGPLLIHALPPWSRADADAGVAWATSSTA